MDQDPKVVQARLTMIQYLYRESLRGLSQALALASQPPLRAEEKEALFGEVERAVWAFPDAFFVDPPMDDAGWESRAGDDERVRTALDRGVTRILEARRAAGTSP